MFNYNSCVHFSDREKGSIFFKAAPMQIDYIRLPNILSTINLYLFNVPNELLFYAYYHPCLKKKVGRYKGLKRDPMEIDLLMFKKLPLTLPLLSLNLTSFFITGSRLMKIR